MIYIDDLVWICNLELIMDEQNNKKKSQNMSQLNPII